MNRTSPRTVAVLLIVATLLPIGALGWLGARILAQDREMERQRRRERLDYAAAKTALALQRSLATIEARLAHGWGIRLTPTGLLSTEGAPLLFQPSPAPTEPPPALFAAAEGIEFQRRDLDAAAHEYRRLASSGDPLVRAAALVRLGRVLRNSDSREEALLAYQELERLGAIRASGQPAALIAMQARCRLFEQAGDTGRLRAEAARLERALASGELAMDRPTFYLYSDLVRAWNARPPDERLLRRTDAAAALWHAWKSGEAGPSGRRILESAGESFLAIWASGPEGTAAWLESTAGVETSLGAAWRDQHLSAALYTLSGKRIAGPEPAESVTLMPAETQLPLLLRVGFPPESASDPVAAERRTMLGAGLALTFALILAAAYGLSRVTMREMALARQQTEFVSAVSHEFRTPLTSMRHLTELLATGSVPSDDRKRQYYALLATETERLHRMVESLLDFGRMQAGSYAWKREPTDAAELVGNAVEEFRSRPEMQARKLDCKAEPGLPLIDADRDALLHAVSNLLENARKYSAPDVPIRVAVQRAGSSIRISVADRGVGIPPEEQARLFDRFTRGAHARRAGIRGIGVGLALVKSVVEAHQGAVAVESEPGKGSTFTLTIPCHES